MSTDNESWETDGISTRAALIKVFFVVSMLLTLGWSPLYAQHAGSTPLLLPYGISLAVPSGWRADRSSVQERLSDRSTEPLSLDGLAPDSSGHLITLAGPLGRSDEASLEISIMPTGVSQAQVTRMTQAEIDQAGAGFRKEIEAAIDRSGLTLVSWNGTERIPLGGQVALVNRYRFRYPAKRDMLMESYGVYLGRRSIQMRLQYSADPPAATRAEIDQLRSSIRLALDNIDR